jgi:hypothetical protein
MYLSIDLDYWCSGDYMYSGFELPDINSLHQLLADTMHVHNRLLVDPHDHLLTHINQAKPARIIHVDYHQDIAFPSRYSKTVSLNEGTFFYFVDNRADIDFCWYYPDMECRRFGWCVLPEEKPLSPKNRIFKTQTMKKGLPDKSLLAQVTHLGFAISEKYITQTLVEALNLVHPYFQEQPIFLEPA